MRDRIKPRDGPIWNPLGTRKLMSCKPARCPQFDNPYFPSDITCFDKNAFELDWGEQLYFSNNLRWIFSEFLLSFDNDFVADIVENFQSIFGHNKTVSAEQPDPAVE